MANGMGNEDGTILEFLQGSKSYDGVWFGDKHPTRKGNFWWRSVLREYFKEQIGNAHFDGQKAAGCKHPSGHDALAYYNQNF